MWFLIVVLLAVPSFASCPNGTIDHDGVCASDAMSLDVQVSTEKPPRGHTEAVGDMPPSEIDKDTKDSADIQAAKVKAKIPKDWIEPR